MAKKAVNKKQVLRDFVYSEKGESLLNSKEDVDCLFQNLKTNSVEINQPLDSIIRLALRKVNLQLYYEERKAVYKRDRKQKKKAAKEEIGQKEVVKTAKETKLPLKEYKALRLVVNKGTGKYFSGFFHCDQCGRKKWEGFEYQVGNRTYSICKSCKEPNIEKKSSIRLIYTPMGNKR